MSRSSLASILFASASLVACSGSDLVVAEVPDAEPDAQSDTHSADTNESDASTDANDGSVDAPPDVAPEACAKNVCGGCTPLEGKIGDACGCGGKLDCKGTDELVCKGASSANACGGCASLANPPETPCGVCGSGKWVCDGKEKTKCVDPVTTPAPGTSCGTCGTLKYTCSEDKLKTFCPGADDNGCGGCTKLANPKDSPCGACLSGKYVCNGTDSTKCSDPVTTPAPGTTCGTCKTLKYECSVDKLSTFCKGGDDANPCGGCTLLTNPPGKLCGACSGGTYKCSTTSKEATFCDDPVKTPAPGTTCGYCSTAKYVCSGTTTTVCEKPDDRVDLTHTHFASYAGPLYTLSESVSVAVAFVTQNAGSITELHPGLVRYDATTGLVGSLRVRLIKGTPTATPAPTDVLATISVAGDAIPDVPGPYVIKLPIPTDNLPKGTPLWIELTDSSSRYNFAVLGDEGSSATVSFHYPTASGYAIYDKYEPYLKIRMNGCL